MHDPSDPEIKRYQETFETWDKVAVLYQEKFMDLDLYNDTYDLFCSEIVRQNPSILEIGCGPGNIAKYMLVQRPDFVIEGIDIAPNMVKLAQQNNPKAHFRVMDTREIDQLTTMFDAIVCGFCLPYLSQSDLVKFINDCSNLLANEGMIYLSYVDGTPDESGYQTASSGDRTYFYYHQTADLIQLLNDNHFRVNHVLYKDYRKRDDTEEVHTILIAEKTQA